jgi:hypothetical protein
MKEKIIFVDVDGPLAYGTWLDGRFLIDDIKMPYPWVKSECDALAEIIRRTGANVVISSDWKYHYSMVQLGKIFVHYGIPNIIIGITDGNKSKMTTDLEKDRAEQIMRWVEGNKDLIDTWVALDDLKLDGHFEKAREENRPIPVSKDNFVWLDGDWSGTRAKLSENVDHIVKLLNRKA